MSTTIQIQCSEARKRYLHMMFTTAMEGGIGYWARALKYHWIKPEFEKAGGYPEGCEDIDDFYAVIISAEDEWGVFDEADDRELRIDLDVMVRGARLFWRYCCGYIDSSGREVPEGERHELPEGHYWRQWMIQHLTNGAEGDSDAGVADEIVQWGLFGQSVYG